MGLWSTPEPSFHHQELASLFAYWVARRNGRAMPARRDIDPADLKSILPKLYLIDVEGPPDRFRYRLIGSKLLLAFDRDRRGLYVDEDPMPYDADAATYADLIRSAAPVHEETEILYNDQRIRFERLLLPLSTEGDRVGMILGAVCRFDSVL